MKRIVSAAAFVFALILPTMQATPASAQPRDQRPASLPASLVEIAYVEPRDPKYRPIHDRLKKRQVLEELKLFLSPLRLPRKLTVKVDQCGAVTSPYKPQGPVTVCYEYIERIESLLPKEPQPGGLTREVMVVGAFVQAVLHEVARAVFDILDVPVWGREADAADKLAGFMMLQFGKEVAVRTLLGTTWFFEASDRTWTGNDFSDVQSPEAQRFYNYLCMAYGGDAATFKFVVDNNLLPKGRAQRCANEYQEVRFAFLKTIMPHVDQDALKKVQAMEVLKPDDGRR
jgi:putative metallopeptidase DUF4344